MFLTLTDERDLRDAFSSAILDLFEDRSIAYVVNSRGEQPSTAVVILKGEWTIRDALTALDKLMDRWDRKAARSRG